MPISFLNPGLLFGAAAAALPVILHFLSRRRARREAFSDLRFLEEMYNRINEDEANVQVTCPECGAKFEKEFGRLGE